MIIKKIAITLITVLLLSGCNGISTEVSEPENPDESRKAIDSMFNIETDPETQLVSINGEIFISSGEYQHVNMTLIVSGNEGTLVDTGSADPEAIRIQDFIEENGIKLKNIILTHRHGDHTRNLSAFLTENVTLYEFHNTEDGQLVEMGEHKMLILHTPGHFNDYHLSVELNNNILLSGDIITSNIEPKVVLRYGGDRDALLETLNRLRERNYDLVIPGHGEVVEASSKKLRLLGFFLWRKSLLYLFLYASHCFFEGTHFIFFHCIDTFV